MTDPVEIRVLGPEDGGVLDGVDPDTFDNPIHPRFRTDFLTDPRHHLVVAILDGLVVGFASAVHYVHPDKAPTLWINEVGVAGRVRRRGIATRLMARMLDEGRRLGCTSAWLLTEPDNTAALALYRSLDTGETESPAVWFEFELGASDGRS